MPIPDYGKKVIYTGEPYYWFDNKRESSWNVFKGDKGILIPAPKLCEENYCFYPLKWKGFCFRMMENTTKEIIEPQLKLQL